MDFDSENDLRVKKAIGIAFEFSINGYEPTDEQRATLAAGNAKFLPRLEGFLARSGSGYGSLFAMLNKQGLVSLVGLARLVGQAWRPRGQTLLDARFHEERSALECACDC